jgi:hypothetical protein
MESCLTTVALQYKLQNEENKAKAKTGGKSKKKKGKK